MITKEQKKEIIKDLTDKFSRQKAVIFSDYTGLKVNQFQELRSKLREQGIDCRVVKKTLIDLSLKKAGFDGLKAGELPGQTVLVFGYEDEILPAKILYDFSKENENLKILSGLVQGDYLESKEVISLAKLPSKQELLGKLVGSLLSPLSGLINVLQGNTRKLFFILKDMKSEA